MLQGMTEREYLHSYINTQKSLLEGASPTQNAARYYLEQHRQYNTSMSNRASFAETQEAATMNFKKAQAEYEAKRQAKLKEVTQRVTGQSGS